MMLPNLEKLEGISSSGGEGAERGEGVGEECAESGLGGEGRERRMLPNFEEKVVGSSSSSSSSLEEAPGGPAWGLQISLSLSLSQGFLSQPVRPAADLLLLSK